MNQPYKKQDSSTFSLWDNYAPAMGQKAPENTQSYNRYGQPTVMIDGLIEWHGSIK